MQAALAAGLSGLAITDHGPGHRFYGVRRSDFPVMRAEVDRLRKVYPQLKLYLGVEANIVSTGNHLDVGKEDLKYFDFILGDIITGFPKGTARETGLTLTARPRKPGADAFDQKYGHGGQGAL